MPHLKANQFSVPSKSDFYALQKMLDAAMAYSSEPNEQDRRSVYCDARGETWYLRDRTNGNDQHEPLRFAVDGDSWLTVCLDFTGSRVVGTRNPNQNLLELENTGSGNLRDVRLTGGNWIGGRTGIKIRAMEYCQIDNLELTQNWLSALDIQGHGSRSVRLQNIGIQEPLSFSALIEGPVEFHNLRACESVGGFICWNGNVAMRDSHLSGFDMADSVERWPFMDWGGENMWEAAGHPKPQDLLPAAGDGAPAVPMRPVFTLLAGCSLHFDGYIQTSYLPGEPSPDNPSQANVLFNLRKAGNLDVEADIHCNKEVQAIVAEEYLYANKDEYWTDVRLRGLTARSDVRLHRRTLPWPPATVQYPTVRSRTKFSGYARMRNGSQILADEHSAADATGLDVIDITT